MNEALLLLLLAGLGLYMYQRANCPTYIDSADGPVEIPYNNRHQCVVKGKRRDNKPVDIPTDALLVPLEIAVESM